MKVYFIVGTIDSIIDFQCTILMRDKAQLNSLIMLKVYWYNYIFLYSVFEISKVIIGGHEKHYLISIIKCKFIEFRVRQNKAVIFAFLTDRKWNAIKNNFLWRCNLIKFAINQQRISRHKSNRINWSCIYCFNTFYNFVWFF